MKVNSYRLCISSDCWSMKFGSNVATLKFNEKVVVENDITVTVSIFNKQNRVV